MSEIQIGDRRGPKGPEGDRGERGHRGHDGDTGPTGPIGPTFRGLAKFSGAMATSGNTFLADTGTAVLVGSNIFPDYPVPSARNLQNLATNIGAFVVPLGASITFEVLVNTGPVLGYSITYNAGDTGVKSISFGPVALPINAVFSLRVTPTGVIVAPVEVSATIEIG